MAGEYNGSAFRTQGIRGMIAGGARADYWRPLTSQLEGGAPADNPHADNYKPAPFTDGDNRGGPSDNYVPGGFKPARPGKNAGYGS